MGGGSCGGDTWGVIMAGSLGCFLWSPAAALSSRDDVPAGVRGGECMADGELVPREARWYDVPDWVREAGAGDAAFVDISYAI